MIATARREPRLGNTVAEYGAVAKAFHWTVGLGILAMIPLGVVANRIAHSDALLIDGDPGAIARAVTLFSIHKTLGVTIFAVALARIAWAIAQPRPAPLHPERRLETFAAGMVHWILYASLVAMPLSGWTAHAATEGFAPILWPLGQNLPLVPESAAVEHVAATLHMTFGYLLTGAILLHVAGAAKHALIDRDGTLRRMLPGGGAPAVPDPRAGHGAAAPLAAVAVYAVALGLGAWLSGAPAPAAAPALEATAPAPVSGWTVEEGALTIAVTQLGSRVEGGFADWTAAIEFEEEARNGGSHGEVQVRVNLASLTLGAVTTQAMGPDFLDTATSPVAVVTGTIWRRPDFSEGDGESHVLRGRIALRGVEVPIEMPFRLFPDGDRARATGVLTVDRRDFGIGAAYPGEDSLAFAVEIAFDLTAVRGVP